jgi:acetyl-CoA carboxylase biotin carboxyl carrier protein
VEELRSPMVGRIVEIMIQPGATVGEDDEVLLLESMKMQIPITAPRAGTLREVRVGVGDTVQEGDVLFVIA